MRRPPPAMLLALLLFCGVPACTLLAPKPDQTQFFVLTPLAPASASAGSNTLQIGVGPIMVPEYLDRTNIVRRFAANRIAISEFEWWAEPLDASLMRVLGDNIAARLGTAAVLRYPWPLLMKPAYAVAISFSRFDIVEPDRVQLSARWIIRAGQPQRALVTRESNIEKTPAGPSTADAVTALSQTLDDLSAEIAAAIQTLPPK